ncbi:MAG TPA: ribosome maturation factor RimP [Longimicrobiales bacterium]|nr:ribosome maturation factor RimP [Longimicrobiales bacterium]
MADGLERAIENSLEQQGLELVELERAGSRQRPILRLRVDRPEGRPGDGVSVDDCARASRVLETMLEARGDVPARYTLEVSSPGVERPLVRDRDYVRFAGSEVALKGARALAGRAKRLEGTLIGLSEDGGAVLLRLPDGEEVTVAREDITRAHLVFRWGGGR